MDENGYCCFKGGMMDFKVNILGVKVLKEPEYTLKKVIVPGKWWWSRDREIGILENEFMRLEGPYDAILINAVLAKMKVRLI